MRYPSRKHVYEMFRPDTYQAINPLAKAELEKRVMWPSSRGRPAPRMLNRDVVAWPAAVFVI